MKKQIVRAASWLSNKLAKAWHSAVESGNKKNKIKVFSTIWKAIDVALTGWVIYDMFGDDGSDTEGKSQTWLHVILNRASSYAVTNNFTDQQAVATAFANQAAKLLSEPGEMKNLYGLVFAATSEYITHYPDLNSMALSYDEISSELAALSSELDENSSDKDVAELKESAEEIKKMLKEASESNPISLRLCDYAAFTIRFVAEAVESLSPAMNISKRDISGQNLKIIEA